jgi:hypothetical protein
MTQKIRKYLGEAVNDAIACLDQKKDNPSRRSIFPRALYVTFVGR